MSLWKRHSPNLEKSAIIAGVDASSAAKEFRSGQSSRLEDYITPNKKNRLSGLPAGGTGKQSPPVAHRKFSPKKSGRKKADAFHRLQIATKTLKVAADSFNETILNTHSPEESSHKNADNGTERKCGELIWNLQHELHRTLQELSSILASTKNPIKDKRVNDALPMIFEGIALIDIYLLRSGSDAVVSVKASHQSNKMNMDVTQVSIAVWECITVAISSSLRNTNEVKYSPRKASSMKFTTEEIRAMFFTLVNPIMSLLNTNWSADAQSSGNISNIPVFSERSLFKKLVTLLCCLRDFITGFGFALDLEEHIGPLIELVVVPILILDPTVVSDQDTESISVNDVLSMQTAAMECIVRILRWKQCSSDLFAPLVVGVDARGVEQLKANPFRERLLSAVIKIINCDVYLRLEDTTWLCHTCECLTNLLHNMNSNAAKSARGNKGVNTSDQVQIASIFKWVQKTMQCEVHLVSKKRSLWWYSLDLLKTVIKLYPKSCAQYWSLFLPQPTPTIGHLSPRDKNLHESTSRNKDLLSIISFQNESILKSSEEHIVAILCCKEIIEALPLQLWSRSGYLAGRVESSLHVIIESVSKYLKGTKVTHERESFYSLSVTIFTTVPFDKYELLVEPAIDLIHQMGSNYNTYGLHGGLGLEDNVKALTDCMGGKETPDGQITTLPIPVHEWLKRPLSSAFVSQLFNKISEISSYEVIQKGAQTRVQMDLFVAVVRSAVWILLDNRSHMQSFLDLARLLLRSEDASLKATGSELLKGFNEGVKSSKEKDASTEVPLSLYTELYFALSEHDTHVRCSVLSAFSSVSFVAWKSLLASEHNPLKLILQMALEYSGDPESRVRSEACKALGNIMTVFMRRPSSLQLDSQGRNLFSKNMENTITVAASAVEDSNANVRSMALFAIGNIALDVVKSEEETFIRSLPMIQLCSATYDKLFDENEKVINNAIRTSGHLFNVLNSHAYNFRSRKFDNLSWMHLCNQYLRALSVKIDQAIIDVMTTISDNRSWKQRLNAKKQAWGACQALSPILHFAAAIGFVNCGSVRNAIIQLIRCVEHSHHLAEKITVGAVKTLCAIETNTWHLFPAEDGIRGVCFAICLMKLEFKKLSKDVMNLLQAVMVNLLGCISSHDVLTCLSQKEMSEGDIQYLYGWLVDQEVGPEPFRVFGQFLAYPAIQADISLVQRYQSRATYEARKRRKSGGSLEELIDSDEDEL